MIGMGEVKNAAKACKGRLCHPSRYVRGTRLGGYVQRFTWSHEGSERREGVGREDRRRHPGRKLLTTGATCRPRCYAATTSCHDGASELLRTRQPLVQRCGPTPRGMKIQCWICKAIYALLPRWKRTKKGCRSPPRVSSQKRAKPRSRDRLRILGAPRAPRSAGMRPSGRPEDNVSCYGCGLWSCV